ncbi:hypothetical protein, partial [Escherichia coli]|uniref:hypothetical protein n=1 Tax=Escherichia coli TaxID=562 RepID=UPI001BC8BC52
KEHVKRVGEKDGGDEGKMRYKKELGRGKGDTEQRVKSLMHIFFFLSGRGPHRILHYLLRRQRKFCIRDSYYHLLSPLI